MKTLLTLLLILSVQALYSQPIIALGNSRNSVLYDNMDETEWKLIHKGRLKLTYVSDSTGIEFTYLFLPDEPYGVNKTCVEMQITFTSPEGLNGYLEQKIKAKRIDPLNGHTYKLLTDLYRDTVYLYAVSDKRIVIKY